MASNPPLHRRSLRFKLALTYAGIALLTAVILGGILLGVLADYYARSEDDYLRAGAELITAESLPLDSAEGLDAWVTWAALQTQTRVRVYDEEGELAADSGPPGRLRPGMMMRDDEHGRGEGHGMPMMFGRRLFGGTGSGARSDRTLDLAIAGAGGAYVRLSEGPASGRNALVSAAEAWALAAALAVALAAVGGWIVAARISRPVVALTDVSDRMAEGDLAARAAVTRGDEVGRLAESFNTMATRVEGTVSTLRRFVADAAHEIGTPLTALQADLELAERAASSDDERRLLERAHEQAGRLGPSPPACWPCRASRPAAPPCPTLSPTSPRRRGRQPTASPRAPNRRGSTCGSTSPPVRSPSPPTAPSCRSCSGTCSTTPSSSRPPAGP